MQQDERQTASESDDDSKAFSYLLQGSLDPTDLNNLPPGFRSSNFYKERQFMRDDEELAHIRAIVASYFNYKVRVLLTSA